MNCVLFNFMQSLTTLPSGRFAVRFQLWAETCSSIAFRTAKDPADGCRNFFFCGFRGWPISCVCVNAWCSTSCDPYIITTFTFLSDSVADAQCLQQRSAICRNSMPRNSVPLPCFSLPQGGKVDRKRGAVMKGDTLRDWTYGRR